MEQQDNSVTALMTLFNQFKLGNAVFKIKRVFDLGISVRTAKEEATKELAAAILKNHPSSIKIEEVDGRIALSGELLVMRMDEYKSIVEAAIQTMSMEAIKKIRGEI